MPDAESHGAVTNKHRMEVLITTVQRHKSKEV